MTTDETRKAAGYTHKVEWKEFHVYFECNVDHCFYTTEDALKAHKANFRKSGIKPTITKL